ncbi:hypothetical protein [Alteriqipengyuania sp.]|uniref:hypothetical protein n=1 Tax=Alteriqipengyuania sp. TaxID=2800692 RepID=UPI0035156DA0
MSSAAQFTGEAEFLLEGSVYRLTINNMALLEAEGVLDQSMLDWAPQLAQALKTGQHPQLRHLCALVYGALKINHHSITQDFVVEVAMGQHGAEARQALFAAVIEALQGLDVPEMADGDLGNAPAPAGNRQQRRAEKAGTGTKSSGSGAKRGTRQKASGNKRRAE